MSYFKKQINSTAPPLIVFLNIIFLSLFVLAEKSFSAPEIEGVSSPVEHGQNITITGSGFGTKNPVAPLYWNDYENGTLDTPGLSIASKASGGMGFNSVWDAYSGDADHNIYGDPRSMIRNSNSRILQPSSLIHSRSTKFIAGAHVDAMASTGDKRSDHLNWSVCAPAKSKRWFLSAYYRLGAGMPPGDVSSLRTISAYSIQLNGAINATQTTINLQGTHATKVAGTENRNSLGDTLLIDNETIHVTAKSGNTITVERGCSPYGASCTGIGSNHNNGTSVFMRGHGWNNKVGTQGPYGGEQSFNGNHYQSFGLEANGSGTTDYNPWCPGGGASPCSGCLSDPARHAKNAIGNWLHLESRLFEDANPGKAWTAIDNLVSQNCTCNSGEMWAADDIQCINLGHYASRTFCQPLASSTCGDVGARATDETWVYMDDVYIDNALSRIMLCDNVSYANANVCEPQIPFSWTNGSLSATANLGKLPDTGTAYLFVFDAENNHNTTGYPVTLNGGVDTTTAPVLNFSDIVNGPKTGLGDGLGQGVIVTIWGNNLGSSKNNSKIYFKDSQNNSHEAAYVYYWKNADGQLPSGPSDLFTYHKMQEAAFSIPSSAADGSGKIYVQVEGMNSNELDFTIRAGHIYFIKTDGSNTGGNGSWDNPWATIQNVFNGGSEKVIAGDVIYSVGVGSTTGLCIGFSGPIKGTLSNPVSLVVYPNTSVALSGHPANSAGYVIDNWLSENSALSSEYINFSKFSVTAAGNDTDSGSGIHTFKGNRIVGVEISGPTVYGGYGGAITGGGSFSCAGTGQNASDGKYYGIYIHNYGYKSTTPGLNNYGWAFSADPATWTSPPYNGIGDHCSYCTSVDKFQHLYNISNHSPDAIDGYEIGWNNLIDNPILSGIYIYDQGPNIGGWSTPIKIHHNVIKNQRGHSIDVSYPRADTGANNGMAAAIYIHNNLIINDADNDNNGRALSVQGAPAAKIYNNTIYGYRYMNIVRPAISDFRNNIIIEVNVPIDGNYYVYDTPTTHSNNLFYGTHSSPMPSWFSSDAGDLNVNPLLIDPVKNNFSLSSNSPARMTGCDSVLSVAPRDFFGKLRQSGQVSIGAFEHLRDASDTQPPTVSITAPASNTTVSGTSVTVSANASDNIGVTNVQFKLDGANLGIEDIASPYSVTWTTTSTINGSHTLTAIARDAAGYTTTSSLIPVIVNNVNHFPILANIGNKTINEANALSITLSATDVDEDSLTYAVMDFPTGSILTGNTFSWVPDYTQSGSYSVTFIISDNRGGSDFETISIIVNNVNRAPTISAIAPITISEGQTITIAPQTTDPDGDAITYTYTGWMTSNTYTTTYEDAGAHTVTVSASDGTLTDSQNVTITVVNQIPPDPAADTLLMGFDTPNSACFQPARNIVNHSWKAFRWRASSTGSISYFKIRIPQMPVYNNDEFTWAIYDDNNGRVGTLKAYGYSPAYNWTVGIHKFPVTTTVTNANIVSGAYYWLVAYSRYMDASNTGEPFYTERGNGDCAPGISTLSTNQNAWMSISTPPPPSYLTVPVNSYHAWSVWASHAIVDTASPTAPQGLTATATSSTQINLSWTASTDNVAITGYRIYKNGALIATSQTTNYQDQNLTANIIYSYTVSAIDAEGNESAQSISAQARTLTSSNNPPVLAPIGNKSVYEDFDTLTFALSALDGDLDPIVYSIIGLPSGAIFNTSSGTFSWTPTYEQAGTYNVTFTAEDSRGGSDFETIIIIVNNVNRDIIFDTITNKSTDENSSLTFTITATDPENDILFYSADGLPQGSIFDTATGTFSWRPDYTQSGIYYVTFSVTNNNRSNVFSQTITITVNNVNRAPTISAIAPITISEGQTITIAPQTTDPDGDAITYTYTGWMTSNTYTTTYEDAGAHTVTVSASDGNGGTDIEIASITVNNTNRAPILTNIGSKIVNENSNLNFTVSATDPDVDILTYSVTGLPTGAVFNTTTRVFNWTPNYFQSGNYDITFSAQDTQSGIDFETIRITINNVDVDPPSVPMNLSAHLILPSRINLTWTTSIDDVGVVGYYVYRNGIKLGTSSISSYQDYDPGSQFTHTYNVSAYDAVGNESAQSISAVVTTNNIDTTAPVTTISSIPNGWSIRPVAITLSSTDVTSGVREIFYSTNGSMPTVKYTGTFTLNNGIYTIKYYAVDNAGNNEQVKVAPNQAKIDNIAPRAPVVAAKTTSSSQIKINWNTPTDPTRVSRQVSGVTEYKLYRNGILIAKLTTTNYQDQNLRSSTTYTYTVSAMDAAGNTSLPSTPVKATTLTR